MKCDIQLMLKDFEIQEEGEDLIIPIERITEELVKNNLQITFEEAKE